MKSTKNTSQENSKGQFALLRTRRFGPFFWTQVWGALNDNVFKTALAILLAFQVSDNGQQSHLMVNLAAGLFIAPFFLFSSLAGQLADKYEKSVLIRRIKAAEIAIMGCGGLALILDQTWLQLAMLFAMGTQSTFFGPVKYSLLPQHLKPGEIMGGNGMVEMGTFVAILLGTMGGSALISLAGGRIWIASAVVMVALVGWWTSRRIPTAAAADDQLEISWNPVSETRQALRLTLRDKTVFMAVLGISWFWFVGAAYITQLPNYVRDVLHGQAAVVTPLLAAFTVGVAAGSLLCERLSSKRVEPGLIPLGSLVMGLAGWHLVWAFPATGGTVTLNLGQFLAAPGSLAVLLDLALIGMGGGLYTVPLFALIQTRTAAAVRSRVIAANNVLNALAMVASALAAVLCLVVLRWTLLRFFGLLAGASLVAGLYICCRTPVYLLRLAVGGLTRLCYRIRCRGLDSIPEKGAAVMVCNHVSYVDALIIGGACRRPVRFVMHTAYYNIPLLRWLFRLAGVIPIDSAKTNPGVLNRAFNLIDAALGSGDLICIFPEGSLTRTGDISPFRSGIEKIIKRNPVPVIPLALRGLWGSFYSHKGGPALRHWPRRIRARIELAAGRMVPPNQVSAAGLQNMVKALRGCEA